MNTPEQLSVKLKFRIMLICFAAYAVLTGLSFVYLSSTNNKIDASYQAETKIKNELAEVRNHQYELFGLYSSTRNKEKEDTLITEINKLCTKIDQGISTLTEVEPELNRRTVQSISILREEFDNYQGKIQEIAQIKEDINALTEDAGRLTTDRNTVRKTLFQFTLAGMSKMFDEACKSEKAFLENGGIEHYEKFNKQIDGINNILKSTNTSNILIKYQMAKMMDQLSEYRMTFNLVFSKQLLLGLADNDGYKGEAMAQIKTMQNDIDELIIESDIIRAEMKKNTTTIIATVQISVIVIGLTFFLILFSSVNHPIEKMNGYLEKMLKGELTPPDTNENSNSEMNSMAKKIAIFINNLKQKQLFAEEIGNGKTDRHIELLSDNDELGISLINMKKNLEEQYESYKKRREADEVQDKINLGLAEFGDILRNNNKNIDTLCEETTRNLIHYMDANYAAMYFYVDENPDDIHLEMKATYAADNKKFIQKRISLYEGIVGTCAVEKNIQIIDDIPADYIKIGSGFGFTKPGHLIVVPLMIKDQIYGIIELCRTDKFEDYRITFIEKLAEDIASTISYVKENTKNLFKLHEEGKRVEDFAQRIQKLEKDRAKQNSEIQNYKKEIERLKRENEKLTDQQVINQ